MATRASCRRPASLRQLESVFSERARSRPNASELIVSASVPCISSTSCMAANASPSSPCQSDRRQFNQQHRKVWVDNLVEERENELGPNPAGLFTHTLGLICSPRCLEVISENVECIRKIHTKVVGMLIIKSPIQAHCFLHRSSRFFRFSYVVEMERQVSQDRARI